MSLGNRTTILFLPFLLLGACKKGDVAVSLMDIGTFRFEGVEIRGISASENHLAVSVPYGTNLRSLRPSFTVLGGGEVVPGLGGSFDFTRPRHFITVHPSGGKYVYEIEVVPEGQPAPLIEMIFSESIRAGDTFTIKGQYFGLSAGDIKVSLFNENTQVSNLPFRLGDAQNIEVTVPDTVKPASYRVSLAVGDKQTVSEQRLMVLYPSPKLRSVTKLNYLQGDTLFFTGEFLDSQQYQIQLNLLGSSNFHFPIQGKGLERFIIIPETTAPDSYDIELENLTEKTKSGQYADRLHIYDKNKPFIKEIANKEEAYAEGSVIHFKALNFDKGQYRFFQILLENENGKFVQNGIYDGTGKELLFEVHSGIKAGKYSVSIGLLENNTSREYSFKTDISLTII